jgi:integrase/recombinase XerD
MTRKKDAYKVDMDLDLGDLFARDSIRPTVRNSTDSLPIIKALDIIVKHMRSEGRRERTISDYITHVKHFAETVKVPSLADLTVEHIYEWLSSMDVSNSTKQIRLKCLKAFLNRCFNRGWIDRKFWDDVKIKVDIPAKEGATDRDLHMLLSMLDLSDFVQLRDAVAALTMYQTGLRVGTVVRLTNSNVDLGEQVFRIGGEIVKNHEALILPFDDVLARLLSVLMRQNDKIRNEHNVRNTLLFITMFGGPIATSPTNNNIQKRLNKYARKFGIKNINPHALRRGFAMNLRKKGADITLISKALGHSDLAVTTRYLGLKNEEVAEELRKFL